MMNSELRFTGTKIKDILAWQGRRQDWLAAQLGVSPAAVNRWINGSRSIDLGNARRIAKILDVPLFLLVDMPKGIDDNPIGIPVAKDRSVA